MDPGVTMIAGFAMSLTFAAVISIVRSVTKVKMAKYRQGGLSGEGSGSMTSGELRNLMTEVVNEATDPLYERIERLERKMDAYRPKPAVGESTSRPEIEIPDADEYESAEVPAASRRSRI